MNDLPKPQKKFGDIEREVRNDAQPEAKLLNSVGAKLKPDGVDYLGSFAAHIYFKPLSNDYFFMSQSTDLRHVPEYIANEATKELGRALMIKYRGKAPRKLGDKLDIVK